MSSGAPASSSEDRLISLGVGAARIPERLLKAHARGEVLFVTGTGTSLASGLPDFKGPVLEVYRQLDGKLFEGVSRTLANRGKENAP